MTRRGKWILGIVVGLLAACVGLALAVRAVDRNVRRAVIIAHTQELRQWGDEGASTIRSDVEACGVVEMMEYMAHYYRASHRSPGLEDLEDALEKQRERSLKQIAGALEKYTGKTYGTDVAKWKEWAKSKGYKERD